VAGGSPVHVASELAGRPLAGIGLAGPPAVRGRELDLVARLLAAELDVRECGSASLGPSRVSDGHWDAYLEFGIGLWDVWPGAVLVTEGGSRATGWDGNPLAALPDAVIATSPAAAGHVIRALAGMAGT
jgi:fructose-1,6-bisphosphatase/inositol monophosphatase family enzyme